MQVNKTQAHPAGSAAPGMTPDSMAALASITDLPRQQMAVATESACALLRGFEAMRRIQAQAAHQAVDRHAAVAQKLKSRCPPADLLALQTELLGFALESSMRYWQQLGAAALETQGQMLGISAHLVESEDVLHAAATFDHLPAMLSRLAAFGHGAARASSS